MNEGTRRLALQAYVIRRTALQTIRNAGSGHIGGSMSVAEILSVLYFDQMKVDPANPDQADRDRLVLSKGHCSPALYSALALRGFFPVQDLDSFRKIDSILSGHVERHVPGVDASTGSLGQGLSVALGMALYSRAKSYDNRIYAITGDGEIEEGQIWEAAMAAGFYHADNLTVFIDNNGLQLDGPLSEVMNPQPVADKFRAFGWNAVEIDGHDVDAVRSAILLASSLKGRPTAIVASTIKGKGSSVFENQVRFHGGQPTEEEWNIVFDEINAKIEELGGANS